MSRGIVMSILIGLFVVMVTTTMAWSQGTVTVVFSEMDPHLGQQFELRVVNKATGEELERITVAEIPVPSFELSFTILQQGASYRIDFYADHNGNGRYDAPPTDHAWQLTIDEASGNVALDFHHNTDFTDIAWPPAIDGVIATGEYRHTLADSATGIELSWQNDSTYLYVGLTSPGTGWVAIGFDPEQQMKGANIIIGAVENGGVVTQDHSGTAPTGHREDSRSEIVQVAGTESAGMTTIEFSIPLQSDDPSDKALQPGQTVSIILAYNASSDSFTTRHSKRTTTEITLD